jgi:arylsulfatase A-like enzyme
MNSTAFVYLKTSCIACLLLSAVGCAPAQKVNNPTAANAASQSSAAPALIIGITVDQMRYDFIDKYWNDFPAGGFKRLVDEGFYARNLHYNYTPTYTGPGHASIFTGTTPAYHGIIQNDWYEPATGKTIYCASDSMAVGVGSMSSGCKMSPHYLKSSTIGDELKLLSNQRSKVIGIALKDRGAILPAGRMADAAYWFIGGAEGAWASSNWYGDQLPAWVSAFNQNGEAKSMMNQSWSLLLPESAYDESMADNNAYELPFKGTTRPVFPYDMASLAAANGQMDLLKATPFGNTLTASFARAAIEGEHLGEDAFTDLLCLSFSATDYVGHQFGIHSREIQDCYLRLDREIAQLLSYLDQHIGTNNYMVFLTADHGGAPTPSYTETEKAAGGYWKSDQIELSAENKMIEWYGAGDWIKNESNSQIFLNHDLLQSRNLIAKDIQLRLAEWLALQTHISAVFTKHNLMTSMVRHPMADAIQLGFDPQRSGDVIYILDPGYIEYGMQGTTHGSPYRYDTHVPALFFGKGIAKGETHKPYAITDIAATVCALYHFNYPNASIGQPILEAIATH